MNICKKCVMDTSAEEITFDELGVCNFCRTWEKIEEQRIKDKPNLSKLVEQIKKDGQGKKYDVLLGLSGGVDSSYCLHLLVKELGLRPLTYIIDNGWNTQKSDENVMRLVEGLKVPFYRWTIDVERFRELQRAFIQSGTANLEIPTDHILMASQYEMADRYGIKWIISGGNHATEGIMPESWGYNARDLRFIKAIYKKFTGGKLKGLPMCGLLEFNWYKWVKGVKVVNLLDYFEYNREKAKKLLIEKYRWKDYGEKHCESEFTIWFQNQYLPQKFGFDKRKAHYSSLINSGQLIKEEALFRLNYPPPELVANISFEQYLDSEKKSYKDYPNSEKIWKLISCVIKYLKNIYARF